MERLPISGAELYFERNFLSGDEATVLFQVLLSKCAWERRRTSFKSTVPRDEAYYGDPGTSYSYSRREYKPLAWIPELFALKTKVDHATPQSAYSNLNLPRVGYNAALCNLYRNGNDSVGLHSDAEPEMGPVIASLSLGAARLFRLKRPMERWYLPNGSHMEACSLWPAPHRKISGMKFRKSPRSLKLALISPSIELNTNRFREAASLRLRDWCAAN